MRRKDTRRGGEKKEGVRTFTFTSSLASSVVNRHLVRRNLGGHRKCGFAPFYQGYLPEAPPRNERFSMMNIAALIRIAVRHQAPVVVLSPLLLLLLLLRT